MALEQTREISAGLDVSGCRFLGSSRRAGRRRVSVPRARDQGVDGAGGGPTASGRGVVPEAQRGCGWNSAAYGVPMLAWPTLGDQRVNATAVLFEPNAMNYTTQFIPIRDR